MTEPTLPFMAAIVVREEPPPKCDFPFFLMGFHRQSGWQVQRRMYSTADGDEIKREIESMQDRGWCYIKVLKLPLP